MTCLQISDEKLSPSARFHVRRISNSTLTIIIATDVSQILYDGYLSHDLSSRGMTTNERSDDDDAEHQLPLH